MVRKMGRWPAKPWEVGNSFYVRIRLFLVSLLHVATEGTTLEMWGCGELLEDKVQLHKSELLVNDSQCKLPINTEPCVRGLLAQAFPSRCSDRCICLGSANNFQTAMEN